MLIEEVCSFAIAPLHLSGRTFQFHFISTCRYFVLGLYYCGKGWFYSFAKGHQQKSHTVWVKTEVFSKIFTAHLFYPSWWLLPFLLTADWERDTFPPWKGAGDFQTLPVFFLVSFLFLFCCFFLFFLRQCNFASKLAFGCIAFRKSGIGETIVSPGTAYVWPYKATLWSTVFG